MGHIRCRLHDDWWCTSWNSIQTCSPEEVAYIIQHSESEIVVVENKEQWDKVNACRAELPSLKKLCSCEELRLMIPTH